MKFSVISSLLMVLALHALFISAQDVCESEKTSVDNCFSDYCSDCTPINWGANESEIAATTEEAKGCCADCANEIDEYAECLTPTLCINGECIGDDESAATTVGVPATHFALCMIVAMAAAIASL